MIICRVKHLANNLCHSISFHSTHIIALIEKSHIKTRCFCRPKTKNRNAFTVFTCNMHIIRHSLNYCWIFNFNIVIVVFPNVTNLALKVNIDCTFFVRNKPNIATRKPEVRKFCLPTVNEFLFENTIFIKN